MTPTAAEPRQPYGGILTGSSGNPPHYSSRESSLSASSTPAAQTQALSRLAPVPESHHASRDSRISLPEEARQYITNMTDSPITSAGEDSLSSKSQPETSLYPPPRSSSADSGQDSEFLDLGDEESNEETDSEDAADDTADAKNAGM